MISEDEIVEILKDYFEARFLTPGLPRVYEDSYYNEVAKSIIDKIRKNEKDSLNYAISEGLKESMKANGELVKRHIKQLRSE